MQDSIFSMIGEFAGIGAAGIAAVALAYSVKAFRRARNAEQVTVINSILSDINQLEGELSNLSQIVDEGKPSARISFNILLERLFNKLDWLSFLIIDVQIVRPTSIDYLRHPELILSP
jgi:hypothetical protein